MLRRMLHGVNHPTTRARTASRRPLHARIALVALLGVSLQIGCWARQSVNPEVRGRYHGPPLVLTPGTAGHDVVFTAPTPGWSISLDRSVERFERREIFVTLRRPNPAYSYAQVTVEQRLATGAPTSTTVALFARVIAFEAHAKHVPYEEVASAATPPEPAR